MATIKQHCQYTITRFTFGGDSELWEQRRDQEPEPAPSQEDSEAIVALWAKLAQGPIHEVGGERSATVYVVEER